MKQKETLLLLTIGLHVITQNEFVTRILLIFYKSLMMPTTPAEWSMYIEMIQKLPMFVSHMYIAVVHCSCIFIDVPTWHFDWVLRVVQGVSLSDYKSSSNAFTLSWWITLCFCYIITVYMYNIDYFIACKMQRKQCRIKLQVAYTGVSIKSREKTLVGASDKVQEKF